MSEIKKSLLEQFSKMVEPTEEVTNPSKQDVLDVLTDMSELAESDMEDQLIGYLYDAVDMDLLKEDAYDGIFDLCADIIGEEEEMSESNEMEDDDEMEDDEICPDCECDPCECDEEIEEAKMHRIKFQRRSMRRKKLGGKLRRFAINRFGKFRKLGKNFNKRTPPALHRKLVRVHKAKRAAFMKAKRKARITRRKFGKAS
jgi:hypothetical protein